MCNEQKRKREKPENCLALWGELVTRLFATVFCHISYEAPRRHCLPSARRGRGTERCRGCALLAAHTADVRSRTASSRGRRCAHAPTSTETSSMPICHHALAYACLLSLHQASREDSQHMPSPTFTRRQRSSNFRRSTGATKIVASGHRPQWVRQTRLAIRCMTCASAR